MSTPLDQERMKRVIKWLSETAKEQPQKSRSLLLQEADFRFDLTPKECSFLQRNFGPEEGGNNPSSST
ncbi:MAG: hypothetical protein ABFR97_03505 [Thermodesulfobacteriota bacterium]